MLGKTARRNEASSSAVAVVEGMDIDEEVVKDGDTYESRMFV